MRKNFQMNKFLLTVFGVFCFCSGFAQDGGNNIYPSGTIVIVEPNHYGYLEEVELLPGNKILAGGTLTHTTNYTSKAFLNCYTPDGLVDNTFTNSGVLTSTLDKQSLIDIEVQGNFIYALALSSSTSTTQSYASIYKLNLNGTRVTSFSNNGEAILPNINYTYAMKMQSDGKILLLLKKTASSTDFYLRRLNSDATIDNSFGIGGEALVPGMLSITTVINCDADNNILVAGIDGIAKYTPTGMLYTAFGNNGVLQTNTGTHAFKNIRSLAVTADNKILAAGNVFSNNTYVEMCVKKLNADGSTYTGFGVNGLGRISFDGLFGWGLDLAIQNDGKIVVCGSAASLSSINMETAAMARLNTDGSIDTGFGSNGHILLSEPISQRPKFTSLKLQQDGAIIVGGQYDTYAMVQKYLSGDSMGTVDFNKISTAYIYPNPLTETSVLEYTLANAETITVELIDVNGRVLKTYTSNQEQPAGLYRQALNTADLPSGTYFITLTSAKGKITVKAIK